MLIVLEMDCFAPKGARNDGAVIHMMGSNNHPALATPNPFMPRLSTIPWKLYITAPPVLIAIGVSLWLAVVAGKENIRFARATDEMLRIVATARDNAALYPWLDEKQAATSLMQRLSRMDFERMRPPEGDNLPQILNPWEGRADVSFIMPERSVRIQTAVSSTICRRMVQFFGSDIAALGLQSIEVQDEGGSSAARRIIYTASKNAAMPVLTSEAIINGCGQANVVNLQLTFRLK